MGGTNAAGFGGDLAHSRHTAFVPIGIINRDRADHGGRGPGQDAGELGERDAAAAGTSVYVPAHVFPMLPEELSTDMTSLVEGQDRQAVVIEMIVDANGEISNPSVYRARVQNQFQLSYGRVGAWLENRGPVPESLANSPDMQDQIRLQDEAAGLLRQNRYRLGALQFDRIEAVPVIEDGQVRRMEARQKTELRT